MVANVAGVVIQLLSLDDGHAPSQELTYSVRPRQGQNHLYRSGRPRPCHIAPEVDTVSQVLAIPAQENLLIPTDRTNVLCESLETKIAVHCFADRNKRVPAVVGVFSPIFTMDRANKRTAICW